MDPQLRIARPTNRLAEIVAMYRQGLGLEDLGSFQDHDGFDGAMLGIEGSGWHLEFTQQAGQQAPPAPSQENLLVFYLPDFREWVLRCRQMMKAGFAEVASRKTYWGRNGKTFEDLDGYRVVIAKTAWD